MLTPEILFEDNEIIVCYKPAGLAVQTKRLGQQDMETWLKNYRARKKEKPYIGIIHRLDQPVEGAMVFAKTPKSAAGLSAQVQNRDIGKYYYAVGSRTEAAADPKTLPVGQQGSLTDYLTFDQKSNLGKVSEAKDTQAKKAVLDYQVMGEKDGLVCFDIHLHTGRHHQIRLQMMNAGYPLLGDTKYGGSPAVQLALCSYRLCFKHPVSGMGMEFRVEPKNPAFAGLL